MAADEQVEQATALARSGRREEARQILSAVLRANPNHLQAWAVMSRLARSREEAERCLKQVLRIDPANEWAMRHLRELGEQPGAEAAPTPLQQPTPARWRDAGAAQTGDAEGWRQPLTEHGSAPALAPKPEAEKRGGMSTTGWIVLVVGALAMLCLICGVIGVVLARPAQTGGDESVLPAIFGLPEGNLLQPDVAVPDLGVEPFTGSSDPFGSGQLGEDGHETIYSARIYAGQSWSQTINGLFDAHNWVYEGTAGETITIRVAGTGDCDPEVYVYDPGGSEIAHDDDSGGGYNAQLTVRLPSSGSYTFRVRVWTTGTYTISVN